TVRLFPLLAVRLRARSRQRTYSRPSLLKIEQPNRTSSDSSLYGNDSSYLPAYRDSHNIVTLSKVCHHERSRGPRRVPLLHSLGWRSEGSAFPLSRPTADSSRPNAGRS